MKDKPYTERTGGSYVREEGGEVRKVEGPDMQPAKAAETPAGADPVTPKKGK